jgi:hypothetical protein
LFAQLLLDACFHLAKISLRIREQQQKVNEVTSGCQREAPQRERGATAMFTFSSLFAKPNVLYIFSKQFSQPSDVISLALAAFILK